MYKNSKKLSFKKLIFNHYPKFQHHPGTEIYFIDRFNNWGSLENALGQIDGFFDDFEEIFNKHPEGVHVLGYSQGGLLGRALIQFYKNHNVKKFISLSSPQAGQFGCKLEAKLVTN
jgi:palmitoyl-protein thioesterase